MSDRPIVPLSRVCTYRAGWDDGTKDGTITERSERDGKGARMDRQAVVFYFFFSGLLHSEYSSSRTAIARAAADGTR
jgi:hypothetical protein